MSTEPAHSDDDELPPCVGARYRDLLEQLLAPVQEEPSAPASGDAS